MRPGLSVHIENLLPAEASPLVTMLRRRLENLGVRVFPVDSDSADALVVSLCDTGAASPPTSVDAPRIVFIVGGLEDSRREAGCLSWPLTVNLPAAWDSALDVAVPVIWGLLEMRHWGKGDEERPRVHGAPLLSRDDLIEALDIEWRRGLRSGQTLSLALFDCGDVAAFDEPRLEAAIDYLSQRVQRAGDLVFRYDARTLGVAVSGCSVEDTVRFAEVLAADLGERIMGAGETLPMVCVGTVPKPGRNVLSFLQQAKVKFSESS